MQTRRVESISDGIFAVAMTLLVLNLHVPTVDPGRLWHTIVDERAAFAVYVLSFVLVGTYWVAHHTMLDHTRRVARAMLWPNLLLLLAVSFTVYAAQLIAQYPNSPVSHRIYAVSLSLVNACGILLWLIARATGSLEQGLSDRYVRRVAWVHASPIFIYLLGALISTKVPTISLLLYALVPLFFIMSSPWLPHLLSK